MSLYFGSKLKIKKGKKFEMPTVNCNLNLTQLRGEAILYRTKEGVVICVTKEELFKKELEEIKNLKLQWEQKTNELRVFKEQLEEDYKNKMAEVDAHLAAIRKFIEIMKGE